jgi:hypothetical protein
MKRICGLAALSLLVLIGAMAEDKEMESMEHFRSICESAQWTEVFSDSGTAGWQEKWFLDGDTAKVENTPEGMVLTAGPDLKDNGDSMVLWTKESFAGDILISYDYTRLDELTQNVCILYIQATGKEEGPYTKDILEWANLRNRALMSHYFRNMRALHVSYAVDRHDQPGEYVRARQYPVPPGGNFNRDTEIKGTYFNTGLFKPGVTYRLTFAKQAGTMYFRVQGDGQDRLFQWDLAGFPPIVEGRVGLRQMPQRKSLYRNLRISIWQELGE